MMTRDGPEIHLVMASRDTSDFDHRTVDYPVCFYRSPDAAVEHARLATEHAARIHVVSGRDLEAIRTLRDQNTLDPRWDRGSPEGDPTAYWVETARPGTIVADVDASVESGVYLVVAEQGHTDGSTKVIVGHTPTREAAQAWVNVLGFEMDAFRGRLAAWLAAHPEPNPIDGPSWVYPAPGSDLEEAERRWHRDRHDEVERLRAGMLCSLGARESLDDGSTFDGPPDFRVEISRQLGDNRTR